MFLFYFSVGMEDVDRCEEELIEYAIRESIRDVSIDRYSENGEDYVHVLFAHPTISLSLTLFTHTSTACQQSVVTI